MELMVKRDMAQVRESPPVLEEVTMVFDNVSGLQQRCKGNYELDFSQNQQEILN